jgi:multicomponent Na+:H+ antiporter subunit E
VRTVALVVLLSVFWLVLSGRFTAPFFIFMALSVTTVVLMNPERPFGARAPGIPRGGVNWVRGGAALVRYFVWLLVSILKANFDVARRILSPSMPVRPRFMRFKSDLQSEVGQVMIANTITLTPGTVTLDVQDGTFWVHALHPETAGDVVSAKVQNMVAPVFGEPREAAPEVQWATSWKEISKP